MEAVVDFQAFIGYNKNYIIKELTILKEKGSEGNHVLFKPPIPFHSLSYYFKNQVRWLENHYHGLKWSSGTTNYGDIIKIFYEANIEFKILVTDNSKERHLANILLPYFDVSIINLQDYGCPSLKVLKSKTNLELLEPCPFHHRSLNCSYVNANVLLNWWRENKLNVL